MEQEIKEVIYIAIAAIILAIVLGMVSIVMLITRDISDVRNNEVVGNKQVQEYRAFNKYNKSTLTGDEVVECITQFYGDNVEVLVSTKEFNFSVDNYVDNTDSTEYSSEYNSTTSNFLRYRQIDIINGDIEKYSTSNLVDNYKAKDKYRAYLVFDGTKPGEYFNEIKYNTISVTELIKELDKSYDTVAGTSVVYSTVTGILFIRLP